MEIKNKRILFIITQSEMGGAQRFLLNLLNRISPHQADPLTANKNGGGLGTGQAERYEILVATGSDGGSELTERLNKLGIPTTTLEFLKREMSPVNDIKACFEIRDLINEFKPNTLFLLSSKAGFIGSLALRLVQGKLSKIKIIYRIGGWTFNDPWPSWKKKLWIKLERMSAKWKDIIIVNNKHDFDQAIKLGIKPKEKIVLIHNGLDPYKLDLLPREEARLKLFEKIARTSGKIFQAEFLIGTVANLYPAKGIDILVQTAEYFKNDERVVFIVIGEGQERKNLELLITNYQLQHKIFLIGAIKDGYRLLPAFDIFVLPSLKEGFPFGLIEAMVAKLPVVATRVGAVPEIIENGKNGFIVEPGNPASLAAKLKELMASDHLRQEFAIQGHQTVLFNFSEDKMIKETEELL